MALTKVTYSMIDGDVANVVDYGASPSASATANATAINAALSAGFSGVYFPEGTYDVDNTLTVLSNTTIFSDGFATIHQTANDKTTFLIDGCTNVVLDGIIVEGKGITDTASVLNNSGGQAIGVLVTDSSNIHIQNCKVLYCKNIGIAVNQTSDYWIENNIVQGTGPDPALPDGDTTVYQFGICIGELSGAFENQVAFFNANIVNNKVSFTHDCLFSGPGVGNVKILNNTLLDASNHGGYFYPGFDWLIDGNYFARFYSQGFKFQFYANVVGQNQYVPKNITCSNNIIDGARAGQWSIAAGLIDEEVGGNSAKSRRQFQNMNIVDNTITPNGGRGIVIQQAFNSSISGNTIQRNEYGISTLNFTGSVSQNTIYESGYDSITAFAPYTNATVISNNNIIGGAGLAGIGSTAYINANAFLGFATWAASSQYLVNDVVKNGLNVYVCTTGGISASSGGPTGTGTGIVDGTVVWRYFNTVASFSGGYIVIKENEVIQNQNDAASFCLVAQDATLTVEVTNNIFPAFRTNGSTDLNLSITAVVRYMDGNASGGFISGSSATTFSIYTQGIPGRNFFGTAAPSSGTWVINDKVWNTSPTAGGTLLWINVSSGTPGTWKAVAIGA
jgi:hypothetical protein